MQAFAAITTLALIFLCGGCVHCPENARLTHTDARTGYRFANLTNAPGNSDSLQVFLAFSGGGTRAAALSYGVLEELARTEIVWEGRQRRLLDEVDYISAVSGGSFTAAYYALYGDGIFTDFEKKFLDQNIQWQLAWRLFSPLNWYRLASPWFNRSDMAAEFYDRHLFAGETFGDLLKRNRRPFLSLNATDMSLGATFQFTQDQFDFLCSDLSTFPVSRAVAASAAFPILLSPVTVNNYAGSCDCLALPWISPTNQIAKSRGALKAQELRSYQNATQHPYLHLLDGGLADNLGLRGPFERISVRGGGRQAIEDDVGPNRVRKVAMIVVNAATRKDSGWDRSRRPPGFVQVTLALANVPMNRYSFETMELLRESVRQWEREWNEPGSSEEPSAQHKMRERVRFYLIEVSFDDLQDDSERNYFGSLPTSFNLPPGAVARLRTVAAKLLNQSKDYRAFLRDLANESTQ